MIQIKDLNFAYPRQKALFDSLSVHLEAGSITGLLGKNGAGKTSLLKLLTGLLHPQSGEISVLDHNPRKREVSLLTDVFLVPEEFSFPAISINDYQKAYTPFYPQFDHGLLHRILSEFDLHADSNLLRLSHGQVKKFLIAFALATRCKLLALDEPTNGLDIPSKSLFRKILAGSLDENQLVIISTHQVKDVENLIDKILILDNGKVIFQQTIQEISQKVHFISVSSDDVEGAIYSEAVPGGYHLMMPNGHTETEVDIELLFNAITKGKKIEYIMKTNNIFSFQRFILLSKQSLIINKKLIGITLIGLSGMMFLALMLFQLSLNFHWKNQSYFNSLGFLFFGFGIIYSSLSFTAFRSNEKSMAYLLLPASASEKFAFEILTRIVVFILLFPALFWVIANLEGTIVHHYVPIFTNYQFSYSQAYSEIIDKIDKGGSTDWLLRYVSIQCILFIFILPFTGACHFTKSPFLKTLFACAIIAVGYALFFYLLIKGLNLKEYSPSGNRILFISTREQAFTFFAIATAAIDLALLAIAWFKFKEKEA